MESPKPEPPCLAGVILAGGRSTRMGRPKEGVPMPDGRSMIEHVAAAIAPHVQKLIIVGECRGFAPTNLGALHLPDHTTDAGPFAGILAALLSHQADHYLFVACDQPYLTPHLLAQLLPPVGLTAFRDEAGTPLLPFPCILPASCAPDALHAFQSGHRSPSRWLETRPIQWKPIPGSDVWRLRGVNSMDELAQPERP
jgi:molybdopterin-guanine dinucleotide biosynthesis protein A